MEARPHSWRERPYACGVLWTSGHTCIPAKREPGPPLRVPRLGQPADDLEAVQVGKLMSSTTTLGSRPTASKAHMASAASPTTSKPSNCSSERASARKGGVVVDGQHGPGHRLMVARTERPWHRGYPWFGSPSRQRRPPGPMPMLRQGDRTHSRLRLSEKVATAQMRQCSWDEE